MLKTPLDLVHAAMQDAPEDGTARLTFYDRLAGAELFLLLQSDPGGDVVEPRVFTAGDDSFVLAFDLEERLTGFTGQPAPYAAVSGRELVAMLAGQGIGIGLNLDVAPSSILLPATAVDWLAETLRTRPVETGERPVEIGKPAGAPRILLDALDAKLATATGLARFACLVSVTYAGGRRGHLLGVIGAVPGAEPALSRAVSEALVFSGLEAGELDVGFFAPDDPITARLQRVGLQFDLPDPVMPGRPAPVAPGMDPDKPPKLR